MSVDTAVMGRIEEAFRNLHIKSSLSHEEIDLIILPNAQILATLEGDSPSKPPLIFVEANILTTETERKLISKLSRELVTELRSMHAATFRMFADLGLMKSQIDRLVDHLEQLSVASSKGTTKSATTVPKLGRHRNLKNRGIRTIINKMYFDLTGNRPNRGAEFIGLCASVANILGLKVSHESFAKQAYDEDRLKRDPAARLE